MALPTIDIDQLLKIYGVSPDYRPQFEHRVNIVKSWNILPGSRVLEIGPGQGDCTIVLATAVGENGHVDAVDPAPLNYGSPITIGQSQAQLSASHLGPRINWIEDSPEHYLSTITSSEKPYTHVVIFHSLWYFSSPSTFPSLLRILPTHTTADASLCIAEYALRAPSLSSVPHVLAALTLARLQAENDVKEGNVRNISGPELIKNVAGREGWGMKEEKVLVPPKGLQDGRWEVLKLLSEDSQKEMQEVVKRDESLGEVLKGMREAVVGALEYVADGVKGVETMSVWVGKLNRGQGLEGVS